MMLEIRANNVRKNKVQRLELGIFRLLSRHGIPFECVNCLQALPRKFAKMRQKLKVHSIKMTDLATNVIGKSYEEETVNLLKQRAMYSFHDRL